MRQPNYAGAYVANAPAWWHPGQVPEQVAVRRDGLLAMMHPMQHKEQPRNGLLIYGPPGTGKTSLAMALLYIWGFEGHSARFQDFGELMVKVKASWSPKMAGQTTEQVIAELMVPEILALDDVAKRAAAEDQEVISLLVNSRINRGRPTIVTTNADLGTPQGLAEFRAGADSRVLERFTNLAVEFKGANLRRLN